MKYFFPIIQFSHITYVSKLTKARGLPLPYLIFLGQKDGTGGPVSSSSYCPINGRFTFSLTREDQVGRVGRTRLLLASLGDPERLSFCKGTKALMTLSSIHSRALDFLCFLSLFFSQVRVQVCSAQNGARWEIIIIGPESDHCLAFSLTDSVMLWKLD